MHWYLIVCIIFLVLSLPAVLFSKDLNKKNRMVILVLASLLLSAFWPIFLVVILMHIINNYRK